MALVFKVIEAKQRAEPFAPEPLQWCEQMREEALLVACEEEAARYTPTLPLPESLCNWAEQRSYPGIEEAQAVQGSVVGLLSTDAQEPQKFIIGQSLETGDLQRQQRQLRGVLV